MNELKTAVGIAFKAGDVLLKYFGRKPSIRFKGAIDIVTEADIKSEELITKALLRSFPDDSILCEEGSNVTGSPERKWVVDPLDGTTNFAHGYPFFAVSIALEEKGGIAVGVVYDPLRKELFTAERGMPSKLNNKKISVSRINSLKHSLLCSGFPYDVATSPENNISHWNSFIRKAQAVRRDGSAALNVCYVACGRFDGFWEMKLKPWDLAAASLIAEQAGGMVTDFNGKGFNIYSGRIVASNGKIHKNMLKILGGADS